MPSRLITLAALLAAWSSGPLPASAAENAAPILTLKSVSVGFGGKFKPGFWQPVRIHVQAGPQGTKGKFEAVALDGDQVPAIYRDTLHGSIDLLNDAYGTTVTMYAKSGPILAPFTVRLVD